MSVLLFYIYFKNLKNSYTFGFFVLLIRYAFKQLFNNIENFTENKEKNKEIEKRNKEKEKKKKRNRKKQDKTWINKQLLQKMIIPQNQLQK